MPSAGSSTLPAPNAIGRFYLDTDVLEYFSELAWSRGLETRELLNEILRRQMPASLSGAGYAPSPELAERR